MSEGPARIAVLAADLADQIAAGEVVERPASIVKELVENAVDAGAKRVEVELVGAGRECVRVLDDGVGIHATDLELALTRHATSKVRNAEELVDIRTLGFRGEALASIAAVAHVELRSRVRGEGHGHRLARAPGRDDESGPVGMPEGTVIEVKHLFAAVPARHKFLRSEATELGHCVDAVVRIGLAHPEVRLLLRHGARTLVDLAASDLAGRVAQILSRRASGPFHHVQGEADGVQVQAWLAPPEQASRQRQGSFVAVRRRVVSERSLSKIVRAAYGGTVAEGLAPVACLLVEPPAGTVDVNVHPQKSEVRFSDPQTVYAAVRKVLAQGVADAGWGSAPAAGPAHETSRVGEALDAWGPLAGSGGRRDGPDTDPGRGYRLQTQAATGGYADHKRERADAAKILHAARQSAKATEPELAAPVATDALAPAPELLTVLPGPVAVFREGSSVVAVDLLRLRAHLLRTRLLGEAGAEGIAAQRLLQPVVVERSRDEVELFARGSEALRELGLDIEPFAEDAVIVRGVPAHLQRCVEGPDFGDLLARLGPWLKLRERSAVDASTDDALATIAATPGRDPAPRYASRWLLEAREEARARGRAEEPLPGVHVWSVEDLVGALK